MEVLSPEPHIFTNIDEFPELKQGKVDFCISYSGLKNHMGPMIYTCILTPEEVNRENELNEENLTKYLLKGTSSLFDFDLKDFKGPFILYIITPEMINNLDTKTFIEDTEKLHENACMGIVNIIKENFSVNKGRTYFVPKFLKRVINDIFQDVTSEHVNISVFTMYFSNLCIQENISLYETTYNLDIGRGYFLISEYRKLFKKYPKKQKILKKISRRQL